MHSVVFIFSYLFNEIIVQRNTFYLKFVNNFFSRNIFVQFITEINLYIFYIFYVNVNNQRYNIIETTDKKKKIINVRSKILSCEKFAMHNLQNARKFVSPWTFVEKSTVFWWLVYRAFRYLDGFSVHGVCTNKIVGSLA